VAIGGLGCLEDLEHVLGIVVELLEDLVDGSRIDPLEMVVGRIRDGPAGTAQGRLVAPLAVGLGRAPMDVVAALRVDAAHVDALDWAGLGTLEAGLALERPPLVIEQLEAAAELVRDVGLHLGVFDRRLRLEEAAQGERHALDDAEARGRDHEWCLMACSRRGSPPR
jgi:hypothetical protein